MKLVSKDAFSKDELGCIGPVQAIDTVGPEDAILESGRISVWRAGLRSAN